MCDAVVHVPLVAMCIRCSGHVTNVWRGCIKPLQLDQIRSKTSLSGDDMGKVDTDLRHCLGLHVHVPVLQAWSYIGSEGRVEQNTANT